MSDPELLVNARLGLLFAGFRFSCQLHGCRLYHCRSAREAKVGISQWARPSKATGCRSCTRKDPDSGRPFTPRRRPGRSCERRRRPPPRMCPGRREKPPPPPSSTRVAQSASSKQHPGHRHDRPFELAALGLAAVALPAFVRLFLSRQPCLLSPRRADRDTTRLRLVTARMPSPYGGIGTCSAQYM